jgi:hypothetical protein
VGRCQGLEIGNIQCAKAQKIMALAGRAGPPSSVSAHTANDYGLKLLRSSFDFYMIEAMSDVRISDRAAMRFEACGLSAGLCESRKAG